MSRMSWCRKTATWRFWRNVDKNGPPHPSLGRCWSWAGSLDKDGYGEIMDRRVRYGSHVFSWILHGGRMLAGAHVLHKCDNRCCVNPTHLFLGDNRINTADKVAKGRQAKGRAFKTAKLNEEVVREIRIVYRKGHPIYGARGLGKKYGVSDVLIGYVLTGKNWKHVR